MQVSKLSWSYQYPREPEKIVKLATETLGESVDFVLWQIKAVYNWKKINLRHPSINDWMVLCSALYLFSDDFEFGYCQKTHLNTVWIAMKNGDFSYRLNSSSQKIISLMSIHEERMHNSRLRLLGNPLREKTIEQWKKEKQLGFIPKKQFECFERAQRDFEGYRTHGYLNIKHTKGGIYLWVPSADSPGLTLAEDLVSNSAEAEKDQKTNEKK